MRKCFASVSTELHSSAFWLIVFFCRGFHLLQREFSLGGVKTWTRMTPIEISKCMGKNLWALNSTKGPIGNWWNLEQERWASKWKNTPNNWPCQTKCCENIHVSGITQTEELMLLNIYLYTHRYVHAITTNGNGAC